MELTEWGCGRTRRESVTSVSFFQQLLKIEVKRRKTKEDGEEKYFFIVSDRTFLSTEKTRCLSSLLKRKIGQCLFIVILHQQGRRRSRREGGGERELLLPLHFVSIEPTDVQRSRWREEKRILFGRLLLTSNVFCYSEERRD